MTRSAHECACFRQRRRRWRALSSRSRRRSDAAGLRPRSPRRARSPKTCSAAIRKARTTPTETTTHRKAGHDGTTPTTRRSHASTPALRHDVDITPTPPARIDGETQEPRSEAKCRQSPRRKSASCSSAPESPQSKPAARRARADPRTAQPGTATQRRRPAAIIGGQRKRARLNSLAGSRLPRRRLSFYRPACSCCRSTRPTRSLGEVRIGPCRSSPASKRSDATRNSTSRSLTWPRVAGCSWQCRPPGSSTRASTRSTPATPTPTTRSTRSSAAAR